MDGLNISVAPMSGAGAVQNQAELAGLEDEFEKAIVKGSIGKASINLMAL